MSDKQEDANTLYRKFRETVSEGRDTTDAVERFRKNRVTERSHRKQIDQIVASIPAAAPPVVIQQESLLERLSLWFSRLGTAPMLKVAVLGLCVVSVIGVYVNQKSDLWATLVPAVLVDAGISVSAGDSIGGAAQLGFTARGNELATHYSLGKTSTQLALTMALKDESLRTYFAASYTRLASAISSPIVSDQVRQLGEQLASQTQSNTLALSVSELKQSVSRTNTLSFDAFTLGQLIEALRMALVIAEEKNELLALKEMSVSVAALSMDEWHSTDIPKLNSLLVRIRRLTQSSLSLPERRELKQLIEQLNVLLT